MHGEFVLRLPRCPGGLSKMSLWGQEEEPGQSQETRTASLSPQNPSLQTVLQALCLQNGIQCTWQIHFCTGLPKPTNFTFTAHTVPGTQW